MSVTIALSQGIIVDFFSVKALKTLVSSVLTSAKSCPHPWTVRRFFSYTRWTGSLSKGMFKTFTFFFNWSSKNWVVTFIDNFSTWPRASIYGLILARSTFDSTTSLLAPPNEAFSNFILYFFSSMPLKQIVA